MEHSFGSGNPYSVGIEEELFLVDAEGKIVPEAASLLAAVPDTHPGDAIGEEIYAGELELRSPPSPSANEAVISLKESRRLILESGALLLGAGLHPQAGPEDGVLIDTERAEVVRGEMRGLIGRTPECALHVHVGVPDAETAVTIHDGLREWLPLLVALSASSPYWFGRDSGLASARWAITRAYPGRGIPDAIGSFDAYVERLDAIASAGGPDDYTLLWWDLRLHPRLGTVEVREMDVQSRLWDAAALAALIRGLAAAIGTANGAGESTGREGLQWSMFTAMRDGTAARIVVEGSLRTIPEAVELAIERAFPHAEQVGDAEALTQIRRLLEEPSPARQRRAGEAGGVPAVTAMLRDETCAL